MNQEGNNKREQPITLEEYNPSAGDSVVLSVVKHGCVVALEAGQGHAPHKHLMEWYTRVQS